MIWFDLKDLEWIVNLELRVFLAQDGKDSIKIYLISQESLNEYNERELLSALYYTINKRLRTSKTMKPELLKLNYT